jgi:hypothetical protein
MEEAVCDAVPLFRPLANWIYWYGNNFGVYYGPHTHDEFWHQSPCIHVILFFLLNAFCLVLYLASRSFVQSTLLKETAEDRKIHKPFRSYVDIAMASALALCLGSQVVFKAVRPSPLVQLCWLFMPCHLFTMTWIYILLQPNRGSRWCRYLATLLATFHWGPVGAAAKPDWSDHQFWIEGPIFFVHHILLVGLPFYFAVRYGLLPMSTKYFLHSTFVATIVNVSPYVFISFTSGLNVNYSLIPPPLGKKAVELSGGWLMHRFYRPYVVFWLIVLSLFFRVLVGGFGAVVNGACRAVGSLLGSAKPKQR